MDSENKYSRINALIALYVSGNIDRDSFERLRQWAGESEEHRMYVRSRLEGAFSLGLDNGVQGFDKDEGYARFRKRIENAKTVELTLSDGIGVKKSSNRRLLWRAVAGIAAIVLFVLLPFGAYRHGQESVRDAFSRITAETPMGSRSKINLPDGTVVWLNAGSKLSYSQGFGVDNRNVSLEGEAVFDVRHNTKLPFTINTKSLDLQVLGTKFTFSDYSDDATTRVDLIRGKVLLNSKLNDKKAYLYPNQRMILDKRTGDMRIFDINADASDCWTKDELVFNEETLDVIARKLERRYNVRIKVENSVKTNIFYGSFDGKRNTLNDILSSIVSTNHIRCRHENGVYILY